MSEIVKEIDAKDLFKKKSGEGSINGDPLPETPTEAEMREAATPELSPDYFEIGGKRFQYRISNIRTQKIMALALDSITDLIKKIDLMPIVKNIQERMSRPRKQLLAKIAEMEKAGNDSINTEEIVRQIVDNDENNFMDLAEVVQDILKYGGLSNIIVTLLNLYCGIIFAICKSQEPDITREWIEDNLTMFDAQEIFFEQMQKDRIGGKVIDFLYVATQQVVSP